jgi:hypothetical protein
MQLGVVLMGAGKYDEAMAAAQRAAKRHPGFSLMQGDPRMTEIYRRIGFPE